jgi:hypothetical protein
MTRTIQNTPPTTAARLRRRAFLLHAGELYGAPLSVERVEELLGRDDVAAIQAAFPFLDDAGLDEALWALGEWVADAPA